MLVFLTRKSNWLPLLFACFALFQAPALANDCTSAVPIPFTTYPTVTFGTASFSVPGFSFNSAPVGCSTGTPTGWAWFQFDPGTPGTQHDIRVEFQGTADGVFRFYILSSETKDSGSGSPCQFPGGAFVGNPTNERWDGCFSLPVGGGPHWLPDFVGGIDGSGTYFIVIEKMSGTATSISASIQSVITGLPPANDRCSNSATMTVGNGIDTNTATASSGLWSNGIQGSIRYATKQRMQNGCSGSNTEDNFFTTLFGCFNNRPIGYYIGDPNPITYTDNSVFFNFQIPSTGPTTNWYLQIGNMDCPLGPNVMELLILTGMNCSNSRDASKLNFNANVIRSYAFPSPDRVIGPMTLATGTNYTIYVDGVRGSQCDFTMLLTRTNANPVLPAELLSFEGTSGKGIN